MSNRTTAGKGLSFNASWVQIERPINAISRFLGSLPLREHFVHVIAIVSSSFSAIECKWKSYLKTALGHARKCPLDSESRHHARGPHKKKPYDRLIIDVGIAVLV